MASGFVRFHLFLAALLFTLAAGCMSTVSIKDIIDNPRKFADQTVTVEGEVRNVFSLFAFKYFTLNDGTGSINVVTEKPLPKKGERIKVTGRVKEAFSFGDQTLTILVEETSKT